VLPYCTRCGTALSSHELTQPGAYQDVEDPSVYIALDLDGGKNQRILVWTTTPWTLVSNTALAVHPDLDYVEVKRREVDKDQRTLILAESRLAAVFGGDYDKRWEIVGRMKGADLVGRRYTRPLDLVDFPDGVNHEIIVGEDFVSAGDGSGVVHMSPAFGADDYQAGLRHNLAFLQPVDARGRFPASMALIGGEWFKDADPILTEELQRRGVLFKAGRMTHPYPHCWRCGTPLLYYARSSWFVRTTAFKDSMLARNARVNWNPTSVGEGRFGEWLTNNVDWTLSRDRYWGTPLPVWVCDAEPSHQACIGSYAELTERVGHPLPPDFDPHKHHVDKYTWKCSTKGCGGTMRRAPEVIDTWYDSGAMSFAQWHYPFENKEIIKEQFPADFIAEGVDQTRGWFYSLLAIAAGLGDALPNNSDKGSASPYRAVVVNDLVLDAAGQKMSKRLGNTVDPWGVIARHGIDAVRLFLVGSSNVWLPRSFDEKVLAEQAGRFLRTLKNIYSGIFAQYANFGWERSEQDPAVAERPLIDRWMITRLAMLERTVDAAFTNYDATTAARALIEFVDDDLANWYVRLNRGRFYDVDSADNRAAFATLHEVLVSVSRLLAPLCPFVTDWIHRELTGESVHLAPFVTERTDTIDPTLDGAMSAIRTLARLGRAVREEVAIKVRQPLSRMVCVAPGVSEALLSQLVPLLAAELNVKRVEFATSGDALVTLEAKPNFRSLGKKFGKSTPLAAQAVAAFTSDTLRAFERGEPLVVTVDGQSHEIGVDDLTIIRRATGELAVQEDGGFFVALDTTVTPALRLEGLARELISRVQRMRKEAGLAVSDRIALLVAGGDDVAAVVEAHGAWISEEVLATELVFLRDGEGSGGAETRQLQAIDFDGITARVAITRIE
jgi:isoleucyl-tRNA synthetase